MIDNNGFKMYYATFVFKKEVIKNKDLRKWKHKPFKLQSPVFYRCKFQGYPVYKFYIRFILDKSYKRLPQL